MTRNSKRPLRRVFILGAMAVFLGSCGSPNFTLSKLDRINVSTEFFEVFVSGRVFVSRPYKPYHRDDEGYVQAEYFSPDGTSISCSRFFGKYIASRRHWRVEARGRSHAAFRFWKLNEKPDNGVKGHIPVRYIPKTGYFSMSLFSHRIYRVGWIQDEFPRSAKDACPTLELPAGVPVNERQTSTDIGDMRTQNPGAPIRNYPGSEKLP